MVRGHGLAVVLGAVLLCSVFFFSIAGCAYDMLIVSAAMAVAMAALGHVPKGGIWWCAYSQATACLGPKLVIDFTLKTGRR